MKIGAATYSRNVVEEKQILEVQFVRHFPFPRTNGPSLVSVEMSALVTHPKSNKAGM
jgi:hypothetical protein